MQSGNNFYSPAVGTSISFNVSKAPQTITFSTPSTLNLGQSPYTLTATSSSGLTVTLTTNVPNICTVNGKVLTMIVEGDCSLTARQSGSASYLEAQIVTKVISIAKTQQTIDFLPPALLNGIQFPYTLSAISNSGLSVTLTSNSSSICTVSEKVLIMVAEGDCSITARRSGNSSYTDASSVTKIIKLAKATQTITFDSSLEFTLLQTPQTLSATASSGLTVTLTSNTSTICTVSGKVLTLLTEGNCSVTANQDGTTSYSKAPTVTRVISISKSTQSISFSPPSSLTLRQSPYTLTATSSSGLAVTLISSTPNVCTIVGKVLSLIDVGTCVVSATQTGTSVYSPAASIVAFVSISRESQAITFNPPSTLAGNLFPYTFVATSSSGLTVTLTSNTSNVCSVNGKVLTMITEGDCSVTATQIGNNSFSEASSVTKVVKLTKASQSISFNAPTNLTGENSRYYPQVSTSSGLIHTLTVDTPSICTVESMYWIVWLELGNCSITASQSGNDTFGPAANVTRIITLSKANQVIRFSYSGTGNLFAESPITITAWSAAGSGRGPDVNLSSNSPQVCSLNANVVTMVAAGNCTIVARQPGGKFFNAAPDVFHTFGAFRTAQTINFFLPTSLTATNFPYALSATSSAGLPISYNVTTPDKCAVSGNVLSMITAGYCEVVATQQGNALFLGATLQSRLSLLAKGAGIINLITPLVANQARGDFPVIERQPPVFTIQATSNSGSQPYGVSYNASVCTFSGLNLNIVGPGTCNFNIIAPPTDLYTEAVSRALGFVIR